jgi:DNA topoisomerase-2
MSRQIKQIDMRQSILTRSMWAGCKTPKVIHMFLSDEKTIDLRKCVFIPALFKCIDEIIVNATDHYKIYPKEVTTIDISLDDTGTITVYNNGPGIPITKCQTTSGREIYAPQMAFTETLAGSNLDDTERVVGGQNGIGAKIVSVLSDTMRVETFDDVTGLLYIQNISDTMLKIEEPFIWSSANKKNISGSGNKPKKSQLVAHTSVTFLPKYELFGIKIEDYISDLRILIRTRAEQAAVCVDAKVSYNGEVLKYATFAEFCERFSIATDHVAFSMKNTKKSEWNWDVCVAISDGRERNFSLINGIPVNKGGNHITYIQSQIIEAFTPKIEQELKSEGIETKKGAKSAVNKNMIINNLFIFVRGSVPNPTFTGQVKEFLEGSEKTDEVFSFDHYTISKSDTNKLWNALKDNIMEAIRGKFTEKITTRTKRQRIDLDHYREARNCRNSKLCMDCSLLITEGVSAAGTADSGLKSSKTGDFNYDWFGYYCIGGVPVNALKESIEVAGRVKAREKLKNNKKIINLIKVLGLDFGRSYETEEEYKMLRYGSIIGLTDQDIDGFNIFGLLATFFLTFWPALVRRGFVKRINTPVIRAYPKKRIKSGESNRETLRTSKKANTKEFAKEFYTEPEYREWVHEYEAKKGTDTVLRDYDVHYYKGLASHVDSRGEVVQMFKNIGEKICVFSLDEEAIKNMHIYYGKEPDLRKDILRSQFEPQQYGITKELALSSHFTQYTRLYQHDNIIRKLLNACDGFVASRRKVYYTACQTAKKDIKVAILAADCVRIAEYHHGEASIEQTIVGMAQAFPKALKLPLLLPFGQFGTMANGYNDTGAPRYIYTRLNKRLAQSIFRPEDDFILEYELDEGKRLEPKRYMPIIPYVLCENSDIPGTGWRITIHARDVFDVIKNVRRMIMGEIKECEKLKPDISGFNGKIRTVVDNKGTKKSYYVGKYIWDEANNKVIIKELPPSQYSQRYLFGKQSIEKEKAKVGKSTKGKIATKNNKKTAKKNEDDEEKSAKVDAIKVVPMLFRTDYIKDYRDDTKEDTGVHIELLLTDDAASKIQEEYKDGDFDAFELFFGLREAIHHRINLIGIDGNVSEYKKYEEVFNDWFGHRARLYKVRIDREIILLELMINMLENMQRYSREHDDYHIGRKTTLEQAVEIIQKNKYAPFNDDLLRNPKYTEVTQLRALITLSENGANYDYLLNMRDRDKTEQSYMKRQAEIDKLKKRLESLRDNGEFEMPGSKIWLQELEELEIAIIEGRKTKWLYEELAKYQDIFED